MAATGTGRGGKRVGAGRKKGSTIQKIMEGKAAEKIKEARANGEDIVENFEKYFTPLLKAVKPVGGDFFNAEEICINVYQWLASHNCEKLVPHELVQQYAVNSARWQQSEMLISKTGLMGKHPTTGGDVASPYVAMSLQYQKQANSSWAQIYEIVKENCSESVTSLSDSQDEMEKLLIKGKPKKN
jgi:hypothetical protein